MYLRVQQLCEIPCCKETNSVTEGELFCILNLENHVRASLSHQFLPGTSSWGLSQLSVFLKISKKEEITFAFPLPSVLVSVAVLGA